MIMDSSKNPYLREKVVNLWHKCISFSNSS